MRTLGWILFSTLVIHRFAGAEEFISAATREERRVCPAPLTTSGVDVSNFIVGTDWRRVKKTGRGFAVIKATEGLHLLNPSFARDWAAARAAGLVRGAYHFFHPDRDPVAQALFFVRTVGRTVAGDMPPILDWEIHAHLTTSEQIAAASQFLAVVEAMTKRRPIIYTSASFFDSIGNPSAFARHPLFLAEYDANCPRVPAPWAAWTLWQFSAVGAVDGIKGSAVDLDLFNGDAAALRAFTLQN